MVKKLKNVNIILAIIIVLLLVVVGYFSVRTLVGDKEYIAVYTTTGDLYFGHKGLFSFGKLSDVHILQATNDEQSPVSLQKLSDMFWGPEGVIDLNDDRVVWTAKLRADSQIVQFINGTLQPAAAADGLLPAPSPAL